MYQGFMDENQASSFLFQLLNSSGTPIEPDAAPTFKVLGQNGLVTNGSGSASSAESGSITGATNASPIVITSNAHAVVTGQSVKVASVGGNTAANGTFIATAIDANTFSLNGTTGNGSYTSGGTWRTTGLYKVTLTGAVLAGLEAGKTYTIILTWLESTVQRSKQCTFTVR